MITIASTSEAAREQGLRLCADDVRETAAFGRRIGFAPATIVCLPRLSGALGRAIAVQCDATLPLGGCVKSRSVLGYLHGLAQAALGTTVSHPKEIFDRLARTLEGVVLATASSGSHARAVVALRDMVARHGVRAPVMLAVSSDISDAKMRALSADDVETFVDFDAADEAIRRRAEGEPNLLYLPADPDEIHPRGRTPSAMWPLRALAGAVAEALDWTAAHGVARLDYYVAASGGTTAAATLGYAHVAEPSDVDLRVIVVGDRAGAPFIHSLRSGGAIETPVAPPVARINGLAQRRANALAVTIALQSPPQRLALTSLAAVRAAARFTQWETGVVLEAAGAAALAAAMSDAVHANRDEVSLRLGALAPADAIVSPAELDALGISSAAFARGRGGLGPRPASPADAFDTLTICHSGGAWIAQDVAHAARCLQSLMPAQAEARAAYARLIDYCRRMDPAVASGGS